MLRQAQAESGDRLRRDSGLGPTDEPEQLDGIGGPGGPPGEGRNKGAWRPHLSRQQGLSLRLVEVSDVPVHESDSSGNLAHCRPQRCRVLPNVERRQMETKDADLIHQGLHRPRHKVVASVLRQAPLDDRQVRQ